jgi:hypothetical protein
MMIAGYVNVQCGVYLSVFNLLDLFLIALRNAGGASFSFSPAFERKEQEDLLAPADELQ